MNEVYDHISIKIEKGKFLIDPSLWDASGREIIYYKQKSETDKCMIIESEKIEFLKLFLYRTGISEAEQIVKNYQNSSVGTRFSKINKATYCNSVLDRIANPDLIDQAHTPLCGIAAVAHAFAKKDPVGYATVCINLFKTGLAKWDNASLEIPSNLADKPVSNSLKPADFVLLSTLRDNQNLILDYPEGGMFDGFWSSALNFVMPVFAGIVESSKQLGLYRNTSGITYPFDIDYYMINLVGMEKVFPKGVSSFNWNLVQTAANKSPQLVEKFIIENMNYANNNYSANGISIILIDGDLTKANNIIVPIPTHYITLKGGFNIPNISDYEFIYWDWGRTNYGVSPYLKENTEKGIFIFFHYK